jgi:FdhD protein
MTVVRAAVVAVAKNSVERRDDHLCEERPLRILIGEEPLTITLRSPGHEVELAVGLAFSEGIIRGRDDIDGITSEDDCVSMRLRPGYEPARAIQDRRFVATGACGACGKVDIETLYTTPSGPPPEGPVIPHTLLYALAERMQLQQATFASTGGLHAAAIFSEHGELMALYEDIGRHNALDKLIGARLMAGQMDGTPCILMLSGRASFELLQKARMARFPIVASIGAPSTAAVDLAMTGSITLAGFVRNDRYNIYSGEQRISLPT